MSARHRVHYTRAAARDLQTVVEYVAARSPKAAAGLLGKLRRRARSLGTAPLRGRIVPELAEIGVTIFRELLEPPYRILYRVAEKEVFVLGVLDGRRDLEDLLLERLIRQP